ncbi:uncharacterized protein [Nicotiana tomentosiformis]|uniref:uncharacterized protein n=1 Tax=Nicotiana tomentosiformis TaxID=4098 RepID=UPI00388CB84A
MDVGFAAVLLHFWAAFAIISGCFLLEFRFKADLEVGVNGDFVRFVLGKKELIGMENYTLWSQAMEVSLLTRNKLGFIDGANTRDTYRDKYANIWDRCNAILKSCIMHNVSRDLLSGVLFRSNACAIWADLRERFDKVNASRMYYLHTEIFTLTQGTSIVSVYYSKLKDLWDEYDSIMPPPTCCDKSKKNFDHQQYQRLSQFLMGLNDNYSQARSQILMKSKMSVVNQA